MGVRRSRTLGTQDSNTRTQPGGDAKRSVESRVRGLGLTPRRARNGLRQIHRSQEAIGQRLLLVLLVAVKRATWLDR